MKIRLEITLDNGITKESHIQGTPTPEAVSDLVNQLMSLPTAPVPSSQPDVVQIQQPDHRTFQSPPHKPTNQRGTRLELAEDEYSRLKNESLTIKERMELFLNFEYKDQWFTSLEVKSDYDRVYSSINLSTVSTYLSRMYREGKLERMGNRNKRQYCLKTKVEPQQFIPEPVWHRGRQTY